MLERISLGSAFNALTCIIIIRSVLEAILEHHTLAPKGMDFYRELIAYAHIYVSWVCLFTVFALLISIFLGFKLSNSFKLSVFFSPLIIIVPIIDYFATGGADISYGGNFSDFIFNYTNLFNPFAHIKMVSLGVRIEVFIALFGAIAISRFYFKTNKILSVAFGIAIYTTIFGFGYLPALLPGLGSGLNLSCLPLYLPVIGIIAALVICILIRESKDWLAIISHLFFPSRLLFYILLLIFGDIFTAKRAGIYPEIFLTGGVIKLSFGILSIILLFIHSLIQNDINDREIDIVSNPSRTKLFAKIPIQEITALKGLFLIPSAVIGIAADRYFFLLWLLIFALSSIYSELPMRLRRFYPVGHITLSAIGCSVFMAGAVIAGSRDFFEISDIPTMAGYVFLSFFFLSHIKDFKDMDGDRIGRVANVYNLTRYPKILGVLAAAGFSVSLMLILKLLSIVTLITCGVICLYFVTVAAAILRAHDLKRLDWILSLSLAVLGIISLVWLRA